MSAELLSRENAPEQNLKSGELLQVILEECSRMRQLTDNLLNLARGEVPAIAVQQKRLDLARPAGRDAALCDTDAKSTSSFEEHIGPVPEIIGDPVKLSWVISNLLGNALRYTPAGGTIKVSAGGTEHTTRLEVTDSGPGIPADVKDYIFERFVQYYSQWLRERSGRTRPVDRQGNSRGAWRCDFRRERQLSRLAIHRRDSRRGRRS